ncbi:MAG TPA: ribbon-helix-helix domain-containing protein [Paucimonas sp.]|nr:ribbon-helix-helix domain-containing protein [Paucimonas sp.]
MCKLYIEADPIHYELRTRSIRIHGVVTSIRLENLCWDILARIANSSELTTNQLICTLHDELIERQEKITNFASFLRISCMRYLSFVAKDHDKEFLLLGRSAVTRPETHGPHANNHATEDRSVVVSLPEKKAK